VFKVAVEGQSIAGGGLEASQHRLRVQGMWVVRKGDAVRPHGDDEHDGSYMIEGSSRLFVAGVPVVRDGHLAACGHAAEDGADRLLVSD
jgi:uncharacterized Zn-binding protein involved in type VI secretion